MVARRRSSPCALGGFGGLACGVLLCAIRQAAAFCPAGFGDEGGFPAEYAIPVWPKVMTPERAAKLRTVRLGGFTKEELNEEYLQGPTQAFTVQGRETYWQASGNYFLYYCQKFRKWRIAEVSGFRANKQEDECLAFASDGLPGRDILDPELIKRWIEVENDLWEPREFAGVVKLGTLAEQMEGAGLQQETDEGQCTEEEDTVEGSPFAEKKQRTSKCPAKWVAKKVIDGAVEIGKWVRRLFPKLLGAPPAETGAAPAETGSPPAETGAPPAETDSAPEGPSSPAPGGEL